MADIDYRDLRKIFADGTVAVDDFSLHVADGEFLVLVGPSGSGKTTVLRMTAGLEDPNEGEILIGGQVVNDMPSMDRNIAMVFQNYALYPHMTVYDNMAFGLKLHRMKKAAIKPRVEAAARMLGISDLLKRRPGQLSGGQRQRVAMGRAIVREPAAFLMDEPLSNLDAKLRVEMRSYVAMLHQQLRTTTLYVTHDQTEAMTMGDRVAVLSAGRLEQVDAPQRLYDEPVNLFVAAFIGSPSMNMLRAHLALEDGEVTVAFAGSVLPLPRSLLGANPHLRSYVGKEVVLGIRPEDVEDAALVASPADKLILDVRVALAEPLGSEVIAHFPVRGHAVTASEVVAAALGAEDADETTAYAELAGAHAADEAMITARLSPRTEAQSGEMLKIAIDAERLYFFDSESERTIAYSVTRRRRPSRPVVSAGAPTARRRNVEDGAESA